MSKLSHTGDQVNYFVCCRLGVLLQNTFCMLLSTEKPYLLTNPSWPLAQRYTSLSTEIWASWIFSLKPCIHEMPCAARQGGASTSMSHAATKTLSPCQHLHPLLQVSGCLPELPNTMFNTDTGPLCLVIPTPWHYHHLAAILDQWSHKLPMTVSHERALAVNCQSLVSLKPIT